MAPAGSAALNVSINGGGSWCEGSTLDFQFYSPPNVTAISPASGNAMGGTNVTVTGSGFAATGVAACAFGVLRIGDEQRAGPPPPSPAPLLPAGSLPGARPHSPTAERTRARGKRRRPLSRHRDER